MEGRENNKYYNRIQNLMSNLGIDRTDIYLRLKIFIITKQVVIVRDRICKIREDLLVQSNNDVLKHLMYNLEEESNLLNNLLKELDYANDMYLYYKGFVKNEYKDQLLKVKGAIDEHKGYI